MRDRLIELIGQSSIWNLQAQLLLVEQIADHLLANGVVVPPCKVGDKVWCLLGHNIIEFEVSRIAIEPFAEIGMSFYCYGGFTFDMRGLGKTVFLSREEAEQKLKEGAER